MIGDFWRYYICPVLGGWVDGWMDGCIDPNESRARTQEELIVFSTFPLSLSGRQGSVLRHGAKRGVEGGEG